MRKDTPSRTARKVALNILALGAVPGMEEVLPPGLVESTAELLAASGAVGPAAVRFARTKAAVSIYRAFDWMMPGQFEAFGYRKAFCERQVRDGIREGVSQVLVLGAGYDTLCWRLAPEFPGVRFFEIDHPATARLKAKGVAAMGERKDLRLIPEDLGERRLTDVLADEKAWDPEAKSVVLAEGLLMYLPPSAVRDLLEQCASMTGSGSRIAFTYVGTDADGRFDAGPWTGLVLWLLRAAGEPWRWGIRPERLGPFLEASGWMGVPERTEKHGIEFFGAASR